MATNPDRQTPDQARAKYLEGDDTAFRDVPRYKAKKIEETEPIWAVVDRRNADRQTIFMYKSKARAEERAKMLNEKFDKTGQPEPTYVMDETLW